MERSKQVRNKQDEGTVMTLLDSSDYTNMMEECRKELDKKTPNRSHLKHLLKETFAVRRRDVERLDESAQPMVSSIIEDWPCLQYGEYVSGTFGNISNCIR